MRPWYIDAAKETAKSLMIYDYFHPSILMKKNIGHFDPRVSRAVPSFVQFGD